jgi:squalene-hopene/tetraprenyl-beta-curcumene cyclase
MIIRIALVVVVLGLLCPGCWGVEQTVTVPAPAGSSGTDLDAKIQAATERGIVYLAARQNEDGSFGPIFPGAAEGDVGLTALAVWAWAEGPEEIRKKHEAAFRKGVEYIIGHQQEDGSILNPDQGLNTYKTACAIMALSQVDREAHKEVIEKARKYLAGLQYGAADSPYFGSWGYKEGKPSGNLSTTVFAMEALREAGVPGDDPAMRKALVFLQRCQNRSESNDYTAVVVGDDGGFRYDPGLREDFAQPEEREDGKKFYPSYASMTYAGLKSLIHANLEKDDPRVQAAIGWIRKHYTLEENYGMGTRDDPARARQGLYYYYFTFARALEAYGDKTVVAGDGTEHDWARELAEKLLSLQGEDGSWVNEEDRWWEAEPTLVTSYSLCALAVCRRSIE